MSYDRNGDNYATSGSYFSDMSNFATYGTSCELAAAAELFNFVFEVYRNGNLFHTFGAAGNPIVRLRFTGEISNGHFDPYYLPEGRQQMLCDPQPTSQLKSGKKSRSRCTTSKRTRQLRKAAANYRKRNPEVHRVAAVKYQKSNPHVHSVAAVKYQKSKPYVNRVAVAKYHKGNPHVHREAQCHYEHKNPAIRVERRERPWKVKLLSAFQYDPDVIYKSDSDIGSMDQVCPHCNAKTWKGEVKGMCCSYGKIVLPSIRDAPEPLKSLLNGDHPYSDHFLLHLRAYNCAFQMTSFRAKEVHEHGFRSTFRVQGQVYHQIGSVLPPPNQPATFLQIYFIPDVQEQTTRRLTIFSDLNRNLVQEIQDLLHEHNSYVSSFKTALEILPPESDNHRLVIRADCAPVGEHAGRYNEPTLSEVAVIMVGEPTDRRDILLQKRSGNPIKISETHRSYDALQYPLMFCRGEDGYHFLIAHVEPDSGLPTKKKTSAAEFYAYRLMVRQGDPNLIHKFRQLFNQFLVDMYAKIESERLLYIRINQKKLRADNYIHLQDALRREESIEALGQLVILPSSFTGGPRYMHSRTQDAFCYVRKFGRPDLFITITTNPKWSEITEELAAGQNSQDRHDIVSRVFHLKLKCLMALLTKGRIFGNVRCFMYSVEWQKRGLPHAHLLLWLEERIRGDQIDQVIRAELPDPENDIQLFLIVKHHMVHGPCGPLNPQSKCMKEGRCSKRYPKPFVAQTMTGDDSYPTYRRRAPDEGGFTTPFKVRGENMSIDNRWIVPYSPVLSRTFQTHINVEICSSVKSIKYICKYINKGSDQASFEIKNEQDEVERFQSGRYISTSEAVWRILQFPIHERYPPVIHLDVHLENGQRIYFKPENVVERVERPTNTTLMAFFNLCQVDTFAQTLLYHEVPSYYTFARGKFARRKRGTPVEGYPGVRRDPAIGRVYTIHPHNSECFHLRLLLHHVRGPTSFQSLRTVGGQVHSSYHAACRALSLLEDDSHWEEALREAAVCNSPRSFRELFAVILVFCDPCDPFQLWTKFREFLAEDYLREAKKILPQTTYESAPHLFGLCLKDLQVITLRIGGKTLRDCHLPDPPTCDIVPNMDYARETAYQASVLMSFVTEIEPRLTNEQMTVYKEIISSLATHSRDKLFFLDAPGGTGKTFLIKLILAKVRSEGKIALAVASSGIAATLLPGGRTAHSMFKIPINVQQQETPTCNISHTASMASVIKDCVLIVWDECTMAHKKCIEAVDNTLRDIRKNNLLMGGVTVLFSGDCRQTLPVVTRGTRADEVNASIKKCYIWPHIKRLCLTVNMRVQINEQQRAHEFSELLLRIGDGALEEINGTIAIPPSLATVVTSQEQLVEKVFPGVQQLPSLSSSWLCDRAILTPTNEQAVIINTKVLSLYQAEEKTYRSVNTPLREDDYVHYTPEFLDSVTAPGLPAHLITLKVGAPIMLLRNINPPKLCNGTRLRVTALHRYVIEAEILTGCGVGESIFIPRIPIIPNNYPFEFKRLQFPVSVCFAMTVNKSQGQTLSCAGVDLGTSGCFSHGQFYVACSRVQSPDNLFIHAPGGRTPNVVYKEALL